VIGDLDDVEVMFNDNDSISAVGEFVQHFQQQSDVLEVQARRWFVEDVERAARIAFGEFRSQFDALAFTSGQRGTGLSERQVSQSDFLDGSQFLVDIRNVFEKFHGGVDRHVQYLVDVPAFVAYLQRLAVVAVATAGPAADVDVRQEVHLDGFDPCAVARLAAAALDVE